MYFPICEVPCCDDDTIYWVAPDSIAKAIDSLKQPNVLFQMTQADSHSTNAKGLSVAIDRLPLLI